jgi:pimeloyl-ACP methyl ester carboxylesterase
MEALWPLEAAGFQLFPPPAWLLSPGVPQPVLVLPAFTAGDMSTRPLRQLLRQQGHWVHAWGLGRNIGPTRHAADGMRRLVAQLHEVHDSPVTILGWSLGGLYARALARERPDLVRQVITLGSPIQATNRDRTAVQSLWDRARFQHDDDLLSGDIAEEARPPLRVPSTSVYTRSDGVVRWQLCLDDTGSQARNQRAENVEVCGTHSGLGVNSSAAFVVLDRLAQPPGSWHPFRPPRLLRGWYPRANARPGESASTSRSSP